jgi:nitroreductase
MTDTKPHPLEIVRPLIRTRQIRQFTAEPPTDAQIEALTDVARWTGSGRNAQPWRFIVVRNPETIARIHEAGMPQTRSLATARVLIAIAVPDENHMSNTFDEGRAAERILIGAGMLDLGAGIAWIVPAVRPLVAELLHLPSGWFVRTLVVVGHPTQEARKPKSAPGTARLPREQTVFEERWPAD